MQSLEELICPECHTIFNDGDNIPLMMPDCGHTICQLCIEDMLQRANGQQILCPEDGIIAANKFDIQQFPRNCQLLKMVKKQRIGQQSRCSTRNDEEKQMEYKVQLTNFIQADSKVDLCQEHLEKLEIVCLTDRVRICTRCALFGAHRHHEVRSVEDVIKEITSKAEAIMQVYQKIQLKQQELVEQKYYDSITDKFQSILQEAHMTVKEKFRELHQLLDSKESKLMEQLTTLTINLEQQTKKQLKEIIQSSLSSAELWKITANDRLVYFSTKTENGEMPLDLLQTQDYVCVEKGRGIQEDLEKTQRLLDSKVQNIKLKKLRVDLKKAEIDKCFDNLFTVTLQLNNTPHSKKEDIDLKRNESFTRITTQDFFSSFCQEEPMLLKDISMADWSEIVDDTQITQVKSPIRAQEEFFKNKPVEQKATPMKQQLTTVTNRMNDRTQTANLGHNNRGSMVQQSPQCRDDVTNLRQGISPTPKLPDNKKRKAYKINEKFQQLYLALKSDNLEIADFSNAGICICKLELNDDGVIHLGEILRTLKKVKQLKLVRNKITDEGACRLLDYLAENPCVLQSVHLSSNLISERTLDYLITLVKTAQLPKSIYLNQTLINTTKSKKKIEELKKVGYMVNI